MLWYNRFHTLNMSSPVIKCKTKLVLMHTALHVLL